MIAKRHTLANALRVAAEQYDADALAHSKPPPEGVMDPAGRARLVQCFTDQAADVRRLADEIEQADTIRLED